MNEYLAWHKEQWWHFFMKPFYGLCFRKKEGVRFLNFEVLLPEACEDFCVLSAAGQIHVVCQDKTGSILYLALENDTWRKTVLLESKAAAPYPKHFQLHAIGGFINLFYTIIYKEKHMLVHQIITAEDRPPTVIDRIHAAKPLFSVQCHTGTDLTILYENEAGVTGTRLYRWSKKSFGSFMPIFPSANCLVRNFLSEKGGKIHYVAFQTVENIHNLIYFEKMPEGNYSQPITIYLDCPQNAAPILCRNKEKLYIVWQESGGIFSSHLIEGDTKWSKPIRYMTPAGSEAFLYTISQNGKNHLAYGYPREHDVFLYASLELSDILTETPPLKFRPKGYEAEAFAKSEGALPEESVVAPPDPLTLQLKKEVTNLKEQLLQFRIMLADITSRLEQFEKPSGSETVPLAESEEDIDHVLLGNASSLSN